MDYKSLLIILVVCYLGCVLAEDKETETTSDLEAAPSGRFLDLGSIFNKYPSTSYSSRPSYYPSYGGGGGSYGGGGGSYYPSSGGGYYPSSGYPQGGSGYYPSQGGNYPSQGGYYPSQGGYYPGSSQGGYYPGSSQGGYYPGSSQGGYYPGSGTNVIGGGYGGYGGYGGSGGNGGLQSYHGYINSDYYNGNRNLGHGYYPGTNRLGISRNSYSQPEYVSGYRGYN